MKKLQILLLTIILTIIPINVLSNTYDDIDRHFITEQEGIVLHPYNDIAGYKTYCIGRLASRSMVLKQTYSYEECEHLLEYDLTLFSDAINECINRELNPNEYTAVVDFAYNLGVHSYCISTLSKDVNDNNNLKIREDFLAWDKVDIKGRLIDNNSIRNRRLREYKLYIKPYKKH